MTTITKTEIRDTLRGLGSSADVVATTLSNSFIDGDVNSDTRNPIAVFLREAFNLRTGVTATTSSITVRGTTIPTPRAISTYLNRIDTQSMYRNTIRSHEGLITAKFGW